MFRVEYAMYHRVKGRSQGFGIGSEHECATIEEAKKKKAEIEKCVETLFGKPDYMRVGEWESRFRYQGYQHYIDISELEG